MKKTLFLWIILISSIGIRAEEAHPDTVKVGIYVTSIHNIDFKEKQYDINMWLWLKYKRAEFDFEKNLEIPMAKTFEKSYTTVDTLEDGTIYMLMKLQCTMKGTWKINYFPFDQQKLRFAIENSQYDSKNLVFLKDTLGKHYGKYFLMQWEKDSFKISADKVIYETGFGDESLARPQTEYSTFKVVIVVHRHSWELFFKIFLGMYISFLIAFMCFFIHIDNMDSRLALSVGALFATIGNKYIIDSSLPETNSFTLVDWLHGLTLFYIFLVIASSVYTLTLMKKDEDRTRAENFNRVMRYALFTAYVVLNAWLVYNAVSSTALV
jgi:hypothetical protein